MSTSTHKATYKFPSTTLVNEVKKSMKPQGKKFQLVAKKVKSPTGKAYVVLYTKKQFEREQKLQEKKELKEAAKYAGKQMKLAQKLFLKAEKKTAKDAERAAKKQANKEAKDAERAAKKQANKKAKDAERAAKKQVVTGRLTAENLALLGEAYWAKGPPKATELSRND